MPGSIRRDSPAASQRTDGLFCLYTVHLDIEADDLEAEVGRRESLGARRVAQQHSQSWAVMEAPTGQRFCVVRRSSPSFDAQANEWPLRVALTR